MMLWIIPSVASILVFLGILGGIVGFRLLKPSAKRTILVTTSIKNEKKERDSVGRVESVSPTYIWLTMPEKGTVEGRFTLSRSSQRAFKFDKDGRMVCRTLSSDQKKKMERQTSVLSLESWKTTLGSRCTLNSQCSTDPQGTDGQHRAKRKTLRHDTLKAYLLSRVWGNQRTSADEQSSTINSNRSIFSKCEWLERRRTATINSKSSSLSSRRDSRTNIGSRFSFDPTSTLHGRRSTLTGRWSICTVSTVSEMDSEGSQSDTEADPTTTTTTTTSFTTTSTAPAATHRQKRLSWKDDTPDTETVTDQKVEEQRVESEIRRLSDGHSSYTRTRGEAGPEGRREGYGTFSRDNQGFEDSPSSTQENQTAAAQLQQEK